MATDLKKYKFNHTMLRVKDAKKSLEFYKILGMDVVKTIPNEENGYSLYYLACTLRDDPASPQPHWSAREGIIELTWNYGTESDPAFAGYHNGNKEPRGFGHICISVDNIQAACLRIEEQCAARYAHITDEKAREEARTKEVGFKFHKKLTDGTMRSIAFVLDPDGYWVEIVSPNPVDEAAVASQTDVGSYRMNHTMLRIKSSVASLGFYRQVLGMELKRTHSSEGGKFSLYFLGYTHNCASPPTPEASVATHEATGLLELTHNWGTEDQPEFQYHHGNAEPRGFGHICVTVDDLDAACERFSQIWFNFKEGKIVEEGQPGAEKLRWQKTLTGGRMKDIAFLLDPDGYWIEIVQNESIKKRVDW
ncbi:lactoylglutathione lyase [Roridomyces roridus]|uniref:Lactoylglutathione lyase n=1 Tax=Roridomyces roridus TaxID=1738132 RepID=A0AAD7FE77_9AGAR|nr:lactoylglutathione lyase [Roridomyces roridus]